MLARCYCTVPSLFAEVGQMGSRKRLIGHKLDDYKMGHWKKKNQL